MKKIIYLVVGISVAIGITAFITISNNKVVADQQNKNSKNLANDSIPLIVMGSFLNLSEDISLDSLKIKLENGSISCK